MIGETILHYKILEKLGEGGMGVVYKAEDTKLKREVAIKFLPHQISTNEEERKRFEIEAQAAAALNHPNISTIHSIEESDSEVFIVMEFIDGIELKDKIKSGPIPAKEAINIAIQIAEGLEAAHKKGIVHRDIKSQNIMITDDGKVKIMDFGLAKMKGGSQLTKAGSTLGTLAYMAPEQAKGEEVDHQSDIWSFGVVLYEMLTGKMPFAGDYDAAIVYNILNDEPQLDNIQDSVLRLILKKCFMKEKANRYQSVSEVLKDLRIDKQLSGEKQTEKIEVKKKKSRLPVFITTGIAGIILSIEFYFIFFDSKQEVENLPPMKTTRLTSFAGEERDPALSPDGKSIAFSWNGEHQDNFDIYVKLVDAGIPVRLTTDAAVDNRPVWSPDGNFIAFVREAGNQPELSPREIFIIPALGGREQRIAEYHPGLREQPSISWSDDNKLIYFTDWSAKDTGFVIFKVSIETNEIEQVTQLPRGNWGDQSPSVSPDGKYIAFIRRDIPLRGDMFVKNLVDNNVQQVTNVETWIDGFTWGNDSRSILFSCNIDGSSALWKADLSGSKPEKIMSGIDINNPSASVTGNRLVYAETIGNTNIWKIDLQNPKKETMLISSSTFENVEPDISPDGKKIIFTSNRTGNYNIWMCESDGTNQSQLTTFPLSLYATEQWSPGGREILISADKDIYILNAAGGTPQKISLMSSFTIWSEDGTGFYGFKYPENKLYLFSKDGKSQRQITKDNGIIPQLYGTYIYYVKDFDHHDIWRIPIKGGTEESVLKGVADFLLRQWVVAKNGIYFIRDNNGSPVLDFYNIETKKISHIRNLPQAVSDPFAKIEIAPDESYILYSKQEPTKSDIILVDNFR